MRRDLPLHAAMIGLLAMAGGCTGSAKRMAALPEGTRFTADQDASSVAAAHLLADGNYGLAIEMYRRMLAAAPDNADAVEGLALSYDRLRRYDLSDVYFQKALALAPRNEGYYRAYAASLTAQGRQDEAALLDVDRRAMAAAAAPPAAGAQTAAAVTVPPQPAVPAAAAPVLASAAPVAAVPRPPVPSGPRLEQLAPGVVRLILPPAAEPAGSATVSIAIPPRVVAVQPKPAAAAPAPAPKPGAAAPVPAAVTKPAAMPPAPGALRNTMVVNAVGRRGIAGRVQAYLAGRGWQPLDRGDSGMRIPTSRILYPPMAEATARRLAQAVPFPTRLYPVSKANRVQLLVGANALRFDPRAARGKAGTRSPKKAVRPAGTRGDRRR